MGRDKLKRELKFKPLCKAFYSECKNSNKIELLHEEIEAIYLMDLKNLYQADAAKAMGISRATFAKIIKNAREKVALMLITGANLEVLDEKKSFRVATLSDYKDKIENPIVTAKYIHIYEVKKDNVLKLKVLENPASDKNFRPGQILPEMLDKLHINFFVSKVIGSGLKDALLSHGIFAISKEKIDINTLLNPTT
jgi:predicted DNA-binding protein (UPF0251 family)/predicted Fe-Mo cluster-binding NifX family protein